MRVQTHDDGWTISTDRLEPSVVAGLFTGLVAVPLFFAGIWAVGASIDVVLTGAVTRSPLLLAGLPALLVFGVVWVGTRPLVATRIRVTDAAFSVAQVERSFAGVHRIERTDGWLTIDHADGALRVPDPDSRVYDGLTGAIRRFDQG